MVCTVLAGLKWEHCTHLTWNLGHRMKWDHYNHPLSYHFVLCWGWSFTISLCALLGWSFRIKSCLWVSICAPKGPMCLWFVPLTLDYICGYQYALLKGQFVYGLYSVAWTEQVRPLQASHLKNGSLTEVRPLQASPIISPCVCWVMFSH